MTSEIKYFKLLKEEIAYKLLQSYPSSPQSIHEWKVKDIANFQSDLEEKINGRVSEKWVYTHLKGDSEKLPREDMLNLLSEYVGKQNWKHFITSESEKKHSGNSRKTLMLVTIAVLALIGTATALWIAFSPSEKQCRICFVDSERQALVLNSPIQFFLHRPNESPTQIAADSHACVAFRTKEESIRFSIKSPYYKTDTIVRNLRADQDNFVEEIRLKTNDYALMIHIFSSSKIEDWKKRRTQLNQMIADDAQIYQIFEEENLIMDLYNKWDFINKLTTPTRSLKAIHVINTEYYNGKIQVMRFKQIDNSNDNEPN